MKIEVTDALAGKSINCPGCMNSVLLSKNDTRVAAPRPKAEPAAAPRRDTFQSAQPSRPSRPSRPKPAPDLRDEEDDDDDYERRPRRRSRRPRYDRSSSFLFEMRSYAVFLIAVIFIVLSLLGLSLAAPNFAIAAVIFCLVVNVIGSLWFLGVAFADSGLQCVACIFIPFYFIVFLVTHYEDAKDPFYMIMVGAGLSFVSALVATRDVPRAPDADLVAIAPAPFPEDAVRPPADPGWPPPVDPPAPVRPVEFPRPIDPVRPDP